MSGPRDHRNDDDRDSVPHDAWLREALRHAPDADAAPPPALSDVILRQARAAAAIDPVPAWPASPSLGARIAAAWAWLGRPPVAAGFASVMVAGVVGLMWWDRPLEESLPPRGAALPAAAPAAPPSPAATTVQATPTPAPATEPPAATAPAEASPQAPQLRDTERRTSPPAPSPPRIAARRDAAVAAAPSPPTDTATAAEMAAPPPPVPLQRPAPMLADAAPPGAAPETESRRAAAATREERDDRNRAVAALSKAAPAAAAPAPASRREAAGASMSPGPLEALRTAIAASPERWRWQRGAGGPRRVEPVLQQWLDRADASAGARWSTLPADAATTGSDAIAVQFWLDERLHTTLHLDAGGLVVEPAGGQRRRAVLPAADAAALRDALETASR